METKTLKHQVGWVHPTHQIPRKSPNVIIIVITITLVTLDHNQLIIIEMVIVHDNISHVIVFEMYETTLIHLNQQSDKTTSNTEHMEKRNVSQENF